MALKHQPNKQQSESWWRQEQQEQQVSQQSAPAPAETRIDIDTAQTVIARAAELQTAHRQTLSLSEVEKLAEEVGVESVFVRQALAEHTGAISSKSAHVVTQTSATSSQLLQATLVWICCIVHFLLLFWEALTPGLQWVSADGLSSAMILPVLLGLLCGYATGNVKRGTQSGAVIGFAGMMAILLGVAIRGHVPLNLSLFFLTCLLPLVGAVSGAIGGFGGAEDARYRAKRARRRGTSITP